MCEALSRHVRCVFSGWGSSKVVAGRAEPRLVSSQKVYVCVCVSRIATEYYLLHLTASDRINTNWVQTRLRECATGLQ